MRKFLVVLLMWKQGVVTGDVGPVMPLRRANRNSKFGVKSQSWPFREEWRYAPKPHSPSFEFPISIFALQGKLQVAKKQVW